MVEKMNREIKFKGKTKEGVLKFGSLVKWDDKAFIVPTGVSLKKTSSTSNEYIVSAYEVDPETIEQV